MNHKNNKIKKLNKKPIVHAIAALLFFLLYIELNKTENNVSREDVLVIHTGSNDEIDSKEYVSNIVETNLENSDMSSELKEDFDAEYNSDEESDNGKNKKVEETENTDSDVSSVQIMAPNLIGMDETTAINTCNQNGYKYSVEYYLGGNATVISQSPTSSESIESGGIITINIGISQSDFSNRLLSLINEKRRASDLCDLNFSEQLNIACNILAQENVNSIDCTRPDGSHWSSVLWDNGIWLSDGIFTTRNNITSLSDANGRIKYAGNSYGEGNLLTPSFTMIGMAYSSNNMLVIIIGC